MSAKNKMIQALSAATLSTLALGLTATPATASPGDVLSVQHVPASEVKEKADAHGPFVNICSFFFKRIPGGGLACQFSGKPMVDTFKEAAEQGCGVDITTREGEGAQSYNHVDNTYSVAC